MCWFLECQCSLLSSPVDHFQLALIHGPNISGFYAILLFIALNLASITSHIHNWVLFFLWLHPFILSEVISPLISSSIFKHIPTQGVPLSLSYHFAFSYYSWVFQGKNTEVVCHSLLQWTSFCHFIWIELKKVGKTIRPFRHDLHQIPYDYTVEVRNRFKRLDLIDRVPEEIQTEVRDIV